MSTIISCTGVGLVTPLAIGVAENWAKLLAGKSGITALCPEHLPPEHAHVLDKLPSQVIGAVDNHALASARNAVLGSGAGLSRQEDFAELAASEVCMHQTKAMTASIRCEC